MDRKNRNIIICILSIGIVFLVIVAVIFWLFDEEALESDVLPLAIVQQSEEKEEQTQGNCESETETDSIQSSESTIKIEIAVESKEKTDAAEEKTENVSDSPIKKQDGDNVQEDISAADNDVAFDNGTNRQEISVEKETENPADNMEPAPYVPETQIPPEEVQWTQDY